MNKYYTTNIRSLWIPICIGFKCGYWYIKIDKYIILASQLEHYYVNTLLGEHLSDFETYVNSDNANPMESAGKELCWAYAGTVAQGATAQLTCLSQLHGR